MKVQDTTTKATGPLAGGANSEDGLRSVQAQDRALCLRLRRQAHALPLPEVRAGQEEPGLLFSNEGAISSRRPQADLRKIA